MSEATQYAVLAEVLYQSGYEVDASPSRETLGLFINRLNEQGYYLAPIASVEGPTARTTDPRTSQQASEKALTLKSGTQRYWLLKAFERFGEQGCSDEEAMEAAEGVSPLSEYATRCSEMRRAGWLADTGQDHKGGSGTPRIVSRITDMGRAKLAGRA